jgi:hypothetical protein
VRPSLLPGRLDLKSFLEIPSTFMLKHFRGEYVAAVLDGLPVAEAVSLVAERRDKHVGCTHSDPSQEFTFSVQIIPEGTDDLVGTLALSSRVDKNIRGRAEGVVCIESLVEH